MVANGVGASTTWTPPLSLLTQIPNATSGNGYIDVATYSGGTYIGSKTTAFTLTAPASAIPSISSLTLTDLTTSVVSTVGAYVQTLTNLKCVVNAAGYQGSTISSSTFTINGQTVASAGSIVLPTSGTVAVSAKTTDSRGRVATLSQNINVLPYSLPAFTSYQVRRCTVAGVLDDNGTYLRVDLIAASRSIINGTEKNTLTINTFSRARGTTPWTARNVIAHTTVSYNNNYIVSGGAAFPINSSFEVKVEIVDKFNTSGAQTSIPTATVLMNLSKTGVGVGKYHEAGVLDVSGDAYANNGLLLLSAASNAETQAGIITNRAVTPASLASISAARPAAEKTSHKLTTLDPATNNWMTKGGDGATYGPFPFEKHLKLSPGDYVWMAKDGFGNLVITGVENEWKPLPLSNAITYNANNAGKEWNSAEYKVRHGFVALRGLLALSTTGSPVLATLPVGARPDKSIIVPIDNSGVIRGLYIRDTGIVQASGGSTSNGYYSLDGIVFPVAGKASWTYVGEAGSGMTFANGWTNYGGGTTEYGKVGLWKDEYDFIWMTGLLSSGNGSQNTVMIDITNPAFMAWGGSGTANGEQHIPIVNLDIIGCLNISGNSAGTSTVIRCGGGMTHSNAWLSITGKHYLNNTSYNHSDWLEHPAERVITNGWTRYNNTYPSLGFRQRLDGMVVLKGLLNNGTFSTVLDYMPDNMVNKKNQLFGSVSSGGFGRFDIIGQESTGNPNLGGALIIRNGVTQWFTLDNYHYFPD